MLKFINRVQFNRQMKKALELAPEMAVQTLKKTGFDILADLQDTTPEDTARAKGGWNTVVDSAPSEWAPPKGQDHYPKQQFKNASKVKMGSIIHISNNVEYITYLDDGHSTQAPDGIVDIVRQRAIINLKALIKVLNRRRIK